MFLKPFKIRNQAAIKGSDRKRLRSEIGKHFDNVTTEQLQEIIPSKEEMTVMKIHTHSGDAAIVYCLSKVPVFFEKELDKVIFPTVYTLWKFSCLLPVFTTWPPVLNKITSGADLMLPGVAVPGGVTTMNTFKKIRKGQVCSVKLLGNKAPIAIGIAAISGIDMYESAMRGKGIIILHSYKDQLWAHGDKQDPPLIDDSDWVEAITKPLETKENTNNSETTTNLQADNNVEIDLTNRLSATHFNTDYKIENDSDSIITNNQSEVGCEQGTNDTSDCVHDGDDELLGATGGGGDNEVCGDENNEGGCDMDHNGSENEEDDGLSPQERMDQLFYHCFLCAIKSGVKKTDLPILTSTFFKVHMQPFCPSNKTLDVKKSSYKKLGKFLQSMKQKQFIAMKELSKGADSITEIHKDHIELRGFVVPEIEARPNTPPVSETKIYKPPEITELYTITAAVLALFKEINSSYSKGTAVTIPEVRKTVTEYVKKNELQEKSQVKLDPVLSDLVLKKGEYMEVMRWDELLNRICSKMSPAYQYTIEGEAPVVKKGKLEPVSLKVETRMGNKKVTLIHNLDLFGIDVQEFAHTVQKGVACSSTINRLPGKNGRTEVLIQGNQVKYVAKLLSEKYQLPKKFLAGLDLAPKSGKKKR